MAFDESFLELFHPPFYTIISASASRNFSWVLKLSIASSAFQLDCQQLSKKNFGNCSSWPAISIPRHADTSHVRHTFTGIFEYHQGSASSQKFTFHACLSWLWGCTKCGFTPYTNTKFTRIRSDSPRQTQNQKLCQFQKTLYSSAFADNTQPKSTQAISRKCGFTPYGDKRSHHQKLWNCLFMRVLADGVVLTHMQILKEHQQKME